MCLYCGAFTAAFKHSKQQTAKSALTRRSFNTGLVTAGLFAATPALAADSQTIKIGSFGPFTGPASGLGLQARKGLQFAIDELNNAGGNRRQEN